MAALEKPHAEWHAYFKCEHMPILMELRRVTVNRTKWDHEPVAYYWVTVNTVGWWPGTDSPDWIEVVW